MPPLSKLDRIGELLKIQVDTFPPKELSLEEIARWEQDLGQFPIQAIEWAMENWRKHGRFFPVPADILDQCIAWEPTTGQSVCDAACKKKHGQGYGESDILWLMEMHNRKRKEINGPLKDVEIEQLLVVLDKHRGKPPAWRQGELYS
jgi:hypothetical protein